MLTLLELSSVKLVLLLPTIVQLSSVKLVLLLPSRRDGLQCSIELALDWLYLTLTRFMC